jgi:hypothetical protein
LSHTTNDLLKKHLFQPASCRTGEDDEKIAAGNAKGRYVYASGLWMIHE